MPTKQRLVLPDFISLLGNSSSDFMVAMMPGLAWMKLMGKIILTDHVVMICKCKCKADLTPAGITVSEIGAGNG